MGLKEIGHRWLSIGTASDWSATASTASSYQTSPDIARNAHLPSLRGHVQMTSALGGRVGVAKNMTKYDEGEGGYKWDSDVIFGS